MLSFLSSVREGAHSLIALVGVVTAGSGAVADIVDLFGAHVTSSQVSNTLLIAGSIIAAVSKGIDSFNNAATTRNAPPPLG